MYCRNCGAKLIEGSMFCNKCGRQVTSNINANVDINSQSTVYVNNETVNNPAGIDYSRENIQQASFTNYTTATCYEQNDVNVRVDNRTVQKTKKGKSVLKAFVIIVLILVIIIGGAYVYIEYIADGPEDTVEKMLDAMSDFDINAAVDCYCPKVASEYKGIVGVADMFMGLADIGGSMEIMTDLAPLLMGSEHSMPKLTCKVVEIEYSGGTYESFPIKTNGIAKVLASDATVTIDEYEDGVYGGRESIHLKRYGFDGWLIEDELFK